MNIRLNSLVLAMVCQYTLAQDPMFQEQGMQGFAIDEIVVTAQKREQSIQDIPASVSSVGADALQEAQITDFQELEKMTAGLTLEGDRRNPAISMRGMTTDPDGGARAVVDAYWNGAAVKPSLVFQQMYDIDRIEVLRGAQGSLQGRTSPAGAISVYTRLPALDTVEGGVKTKVTDDGGYNTEFALSVPLLENQMAMRVAGSYVESERQQIKNITSGQRQDNDSEGLRVSLVWEPSDSFDAALVMEYGERDGDILQAIASDSLGIDPDDRLAIADGALLVSKQNQLTNLTMNLHVVDYTLTSVTSYVDADSVTLTDIDIANRIPGQSLPSQTATDLDIFTQELRLAPQEVGDWDYVLGLYYSRENAATSTDTTMFVAGVGAVNINFEAPIEREEYGIFLHNIFHLTDSSQAQLGLRWQKVDNFNRMDAGAVAFVSTDLDGDTSEAVTASLKYQYYFSDDLMAYAGIEQSYRPGGFSIGFYPLPEEHVLYGEESSNSLEIGFKSTWWNGRLQLNGATYLQKFDGYISRATGVYVNLAPALAKNAANYKRHTGLNFNADATVLGAELDFVALLSPNLTLSGALSYNDARFDGGETGPCNNGFIPTGEYLSQCDIGGHHIGQEPDWSATLTSEYLYPMAHFDGYVRGLYKFTGKRVNDTVGGELGRYGTVNLYAGIRGEDRKWEVGVFAKNLLDKVAETNLQSFEVASDVRLVNLEQARTIGVSASYSFDL